MQKTHSISSFSLLFTASGLLLSAACGEGAVGDPGGVLVPATGAGGAATTDAGATTVGAATTVGNGTTGLAGTTEGAATTGSVNSTATTGVNGTTDGAATTGANSTTGVAATTGAASTTGDFGTGGSGTNGGETTGAGDTTGGSSTTGGTGTPPDGYISIHDRAPGWASVDGDTTGGGTDLGAAVTVSNMSDLESAASGDDSRIILVTPGTYDGSFQPGSNKTIIGIEPGVTIDGNIVISGSDKNNVIIRNLAVRGKHCGSNDECRSGADGVYIGNGAEHVWFDHVDVADGQDGNFDVTREGNYITCSWCKFHYTYDKEHSLSNLIAGSDGETASRGKLNITYMNSWWGDRVASRQPRGRFGKIHMLNNYHANSGSLHGVGEEMTLIAEGCYYDVPGNDVFFSMGNHTGWKGMGNEGSADGLNDSEGTVFTIPYSYDLMSASEAKEAVTSPDCGAGNTCRLQM